MASPLVRLMQLLREEAPGQAEKVRELIKAARKPVGGELVEHGLQGPASFSEAPASRISVGTPYSVSSNPSDLLAAKIEPGIGPFDVHTHPRADPFAMRPSKGDLGFWSSNYGDIFPSSSGKRLQTLIVAPPAEKATTRWHYATTDQPRKFFSPQNYDDARYELQMAAAQGYFDLLQKDPRFAGLFEVEHIGDQLADMSPMALLKLREEKGLGKQLVAPPRRKVINSPVAGTYEDLYQAAEPMMVEHLQRKKFADGGKAKVDPIEAEVQRQFGMEPGLDRATFLPWAGRRSEGNLQMAVPGALYELAKAYVLPGMAAQGYKVSPEEAINFAGNLTGSSLAASSAAPVAGATAGMAIKRKGGNWLRTSAGVPYLSGTEDFLRGMNARADTFESKAESEAFKSWMNQTLGKYLRNEMGTPEDPLIRQVLSFGKEKEQLLAKKDQQIQKLRDKMQALQAERNVAPEVLTRSRQALLQLEKERALIDARSGHYKGKQTLLDALNAYLDPAPWQIGSKIRMRRINADLPEYGILEKHLDEVPHEAMSAAEEMAAAAEYASDNQIHNPRIIAFMHEEDLMNAHPEFKSLSPDTIVHSIEPSGTNPMHHMRDELHNALRKDPSLPEDLHLDAEKLKNMTVPQAAMHVDKINAWRTVKKSEADLVRANSAAAHTIKEYPEQGMKWVQLKVPEAKLPEGAQITRNPGNELFEVRDAEGNLLSIGSTEREALGLIDLEGRQKVLADALQYEGDTMAHCVGGYCPDVIEGKSQIFSLRDDTGKPHATVEVVPGNWRMPVPAISPYDAWYEQASEQELKEFQNWLSKNPPRNLGFSNLYLQWAKETGRKPAEPRASIAQIKGRRNAAPDQAVLPYVQDFVRSKQWHDVRDLKNTGLMAWTKRIMDIPQGHIGTVPRFEQLGVPEGYYTREELLNFLRNYKGD